MARDRYSTFRFVAAMMPLMVAALCGCSVTSAQRTEDLAQVIRNLESDNPDVVFRAMSAILRFGRDAERALPVLRRVYARHLRDREVVEAWAAIGRPALDDLIAVLDQDQPDVVEQDLATRGVVAMGRDVVPELLKASVAEMRKTPTFQRNADDRAKGLHITFDEVFDGFGIAALPPLLTSLRDRDPLVRGEAAYWIGTKAGRPGILPALEEALASTPEEPAHDLIQNAIRALR